MAVDLELTWQNRLDKHLFVWNKTPSVDPGR